MPNPGRSNVCCRSIESGAIVARGVAVWDVIGFQFLPQLHPVSMGIEFEYFGENIYVNIGVRLHHALVEGVAQRVSLGTPKLDPRLDSAS